MNLGKESEVLEFKESTGELHQGIEAIAAILNKHGYGVLYFGVYDNGEIKGQIVADSTIKTVSDGIIRDIEPKIIPTIEVLSFDGKDIIKVSFSGSQQPYSAFGKFLTRVGSQDRHMTRDEIKRLIKSEDYSYPWEKERTIKTIEDLDDEALLKYYEESISCGRLEMDHYDKKRLLSSLELLNNGKINNAAYALFGKDSNIKLKLARFATNEKVTFTDLNEKRGNIYNLINEGLSYIINHIDWDVKIEKKRIETPEIPIKAIREIVVNAFAHTIYEPTPEIEINIHPGKITIFNPGSFPDDLTPIDFIKQEISSIKRNPLILDVLYRCKDVEKSGTGFKRVNDMCNQFNIKWDYRKTAYGFYFTFYRKQNVTLDVTLDVTLTGNEEKVLNLIRNNSKITREAIANEIGKNIRSVQRITNSLVEKGLLIRVGNNRFGYWEIVNK